VLSLAESGYKTWITAEEREGPGCDYHVHFECEYRQITPEKYECSPDRKAALY